MPQAKPMRTKGFSDRVVCTSTDFCSDCSVRGQLGVSNSREQYNKQTGQEELTSGEMEL